MRQVSKYLHIPILIDSRGRYWANNWTDHKGNVELTTDDGARALFSESDAIGDDAHLVWIEADVPLPDPAPKVAGTVTGECK